jgi:hypothetical protein
VLQIGKWHKAMMAPGCHILLACLCLARHTRCLNSKLQCLKICSATAFGSEPTRSDNEAQRAKRSDNICSFLAFCPARGLAEQHNKRKNMNVGLLMALIRCHQTPDQVPPWK